MEFAPDVAFAQACLAGDAKAIEELDRELVSAATPAIAAIDSGRDFIDECLQKLRTSVLVGGEDNVPRLTQYSGRGPLRAWIGVAAARTALMVRRTRQRQREVAEPEDWSRTLVTISTNNPELELLKRQYADAFAAAFHDAVSQLEPRLRTVLRMSFVEGLSIDDIGATYAVHRATAARWITRSCDELFEQTRTLLQERLALTPTEFDRMTSLVRSQLDVSVSQLLPANV